MMTDIGAIIVNWNTAGHLLNCIVSFVKEKISAGNIVVVDQGSTDDSVKSVRRRFPNVKVLVLKENAGYGHAVNTAMKHIKNPLVVVSNADAFPQQGSVGTLSEVFANEQNVALAGPRICDTSGKNITRFSMTSVSRALFLELIPKQLRGTWRSIEGKMHSKRFPFDVPYVEGAFMLVRRQVFEEIGGFDEGFTFFSEDADLCVRFMKSGYRVVHVPGAAAVHAGGASFAQAPLRHAGEFNKNMIRFYERHAARRALWLKTGFIYILSLKLVALKFANSVAQNSALNQNLLKRLTIVRTKYDSIANNGKDQRTIDHPLVSVIIPTYEREECLITLLKALKKQTYDNFEVILVDQSEKISRKKQGAYTSLGKKMRLIRSSIPNRSMARSLGLKESSGDVVLFCDDDIEPPNTFIETHVKHHRRPDLVGVSCRFTEPNLEPTKSKNICRVTFYGKLIAGFQSDTACYVKTLAGANMSVKRALAKETGYFDSLLKGTSIFEEQDFSARLLKNGQKILFTNDILLSHKPQRGGNLDSKFTNPAQYYHDFHHNEIVYFLKNRNRLCLFLVVPFCAMRTLKQSFMYQLSFRDALFIFSGVLHGFQSYYRSLR